MYGNLSQTIVKIPNLFQISSVLPSKLSKSRYREPPLLDTFSQIKKLNSHFNKRYFRLNDHFKENSPYKDLNYNNNKRYISPLSKLKPIKGLQSFLFYDLADNQNKIGRNNSQIQLIPNTNINTNSIISNNIIVNNNENNTININNVYSIDENNRYGLSSTINIEDNNNLSDIQENQIKDENIDEKNNTININENKKFQNFKKILMEKKPKNMKELKEFLNINYIKDIKKYSLPKIRPLHKSISQDDLFKKTLDKKIESLTMIKPEIKNSIYRRKKNIILKKDYDLFHKIYANYKNPQFPIRKNFNNNNHINCI